MKLDDHIISEEEKIKCQICGKELEKIDNRHMKNHDIDIDEYVKIYPNSPTITRDKYNKELESIEKRKQAKQEKDNKTKIRKCIYYDECKNNVEVNINVPDSTIVCQYCRNIGKEIPMSNRIEKSKETIKEKYNVDNISQLEEVKKRKKETIQQQEKQDPEYWQKINQKREETKKNRFGENYNKEIHELSKEGMKNKYGVEYALQKEEFKNKVKQTYYQKTGYEHPNYNPNDNLKRIQTLQQNYGVINPLHSSKIIEKIRNTNLKNRGVEYAQQDPNVKLKTKQQEYEKFLEKLDKYLEYLDLELLDDYYEHAHYKHRFKCKKCKNIITKDWNAIQQGFTCPICYPRTPSITSKGENEIKEFIESFGFDIIQSDKYTIKPFELDILVKNKNIAIEFNGLYWHTEDMINIRKNIEDNKLYHLNKTKLCEEQGIQLIHIFEDEWIFKKDIVKNRLKQILGINNAIKINARDCKIREIGAKTKNKFLDQFHLQGKDASVVKLGAFYCNELISIMTFSKGNISKGSKRYEDIYELNRFCSDYNYHIPGIASKLLEYFKKNYQWKEIFSYSDRRWSQGNLYYKLGFEFLKEIPPNYFYFNPNKQLERVHRFSLRKRSDEPKDIPEYVLRKSEGYYRIWDCGHLKFRMRK